MLGEGMLFATVAVRDLAVGKQFYGETLGLSQVSEDPGGVTYTSVGGGKLYMYMSGTAGTGQATCVYWAVDDAKAAVEELKVKGVTFEHYDMPYGEWQGDLLVVEGMQAAWFKDPDGNVLGVGNDTKK
ncbi:VOC family protein [Candidatus Saccharibacteria bacterium]|nr:VOC family protein [Candidatus Saccharibacteria bacterium]